MIRDEIAAKVFQCMVMDRHADEIADALLPIVERVAREVGDLAERKDYGLGVIAARFGYGANTAG